MPKKGSTAAAKALRDRSREKAKVAKALRVEGNKERAAANAAMPADELLAKVRTEGRLVPSRLRTRIRNKWNVDNMIPCRRCKDRTRMIVPGSVCICQSLGVWSPDAKR